MKHRRYVLIAVLTLLGTASRGGWAMEFEKIPADAPDDAVMANAAELQAMRTWAAWAFTGRALGNDAATIPIEVRRQDFNVLRFGRSCMETPIRIGDQRFEHGLGTHANSEIIVQIPAGARQFKAVAGIDNNEDTGGTHGSVEFAVLAEGKELYRSPIQRGGMAPHPVAVDLPTGAKELVLLVETTPDGPSHDQADWADARFIMNNKNERWLDENQLDCLLSPAEPPFSFVYDGHASAEFLDSWTTVRQSEELPEAVMHTLSWSDPRTALQVRAMVRVFKRYSAVDWVLYFENKGTKDTPILENIQAADLDLRTGNSKSPATLRRNQGDHCGPETFLDIREPLEAGRPVHMKPNGGRPSNGAFPFFNLEYGDETLIVAVGWTGQWLATVERASNGPSRLCAGMEQTHLRLHPGESIRSPRILLSLSRGDRDRAHNQFRRLLLFHYVPKDQGKPLRLPVALQTFDRYSWSRPEWATEPGQCHAVEMAYQLGFDSYWFDAAWFVGGFPNGVGNWYPKPDAFPNGLKPIGDACHARNMKFILWFEPERVVKGTQIATEHPEFVFGGAEGGLYKMNDPDARAWLTDRISKIIEDSGIDVYRNDFNIDPLGFWRKNDSEDRQGMTEIRYVEGVYAMWDKLRARHPGLWIDNCASGGRRLDLEMCMRSVPLWRSDTNCSPSHNDWNQAQTLGLCPYIPLNTACAWTPEVYEVRSAATGGLLCQWAYLDPDFPIAAAQAALAEAKANQAYWYGDFYPLTAQTITPDAWCGWQLHRADRDEGIAVIFRRAESPYTGLDVALKGLTPGRVYVIDFIDEAYTATTKEYSAEELGQGVELRLPKKGASRVIRYHVKTQ